MQRRPGVARGPAPLARTAVGKAHWPPALSRVNKRALMLAKGGALALVTSGVVRLKLPNEKEPEQVFVGAMPADAAVPGAIVGFCRVGRLDHPAGAQPRRRASVETA